MAAVIGSGILLIGEVLAADPVAPPPHDTAHAENASDWCAAHASRNEMIQAMSDCDFAVATSPNKAKALSNRGAVWLMAREPGKAVSDFSDAIQLSPKDATLNFNRGIAYGMIGVRDKAIADYTEALKKRPTMAIALHNRGYEYELLGRTDEALNDYRRAVALAPELKPAVDAVRRLTKGSL